MRLALSVFLCLAVLCSVALADAVNERELVANVLASSKDIQDAKFQAQSALKALRDAKRGLRAAQIDVHKIVSPAAELAAQSQRAALEVARTRTKLQNAQIRLVKLKDSLKVYRVDLAREKDKVRQGELALKKMVKELHAKKLEADKLQTDFALTEVPAKAADANKKENLKKLEELKAQQKAVKDARVQLVKSLRTTRKDTIKHKHLYLKSVDEVAKAEQEIHHIRFVVRKLTVRMNRFLSISKNKEAQKKSIEADLPRLRVARTKSKKSVEQAASAAKSAVDNLKKVVVAEITKRKAEAEKAAKA
jgi:chromosome segregation ATPase